MPLDDYDQQFMDAGQRWNVDARLLKTMADIESSGRPGASNRSSGAAGLMGFMPGTAKQYGVNPLDAGSSIDGAGHYLHDLLNQYGGNVDAALHHYSGRTPGYAQEVATRYGTFTLPAEPPPAPAEPGVKNFQTPARVPNTFGDEGKFPIWAQPQRPAVAPTSPPVPQVAPPEQPMADNSALRQRLEGSEPPAPAAPQQTLRERLEAPEPAPAATAGYNNPFAGVVFPAAQQLYSGVNQGLRDIDTFGSRADQYLADRFPLYGQIANAVGSNPAHLQALESDTKAYEKQQADNFNYAAPVGRFVGNVAPTLPAGAPAAALGGAVRTALPYVGRVLGPALEGGTIGAMGNLLTSQGKTPEEWAKDALQGFGIGGATGGALGGGKGLLAVKANPADQAIADRLGVTMSSGQMAGGPLKWLESATEHMPGSGATKFAGQQRQQIADVVAREAGIPTGAPITTDTLNTARGRIGQAIEDSSKGINVVATPQLAAEVQSIRDMAMMQGPTTNEAHVFKELSDRLGNIIANNNGQLPGPEFQNFIRRGGPLDAAIRSKNGDVSQIGSRLKEALLDAGDAGGAGSQQAIADMQKARYQWKVTQTVAPLMERTPTGSEAMNLPGLAQAIRREFGTAGTGPGHEMKDLSRLISGPLRDLPSSGTAQRGWWQDMLSGHGLSGPIGAGMFFAGAPIAHSVASALAGPLAIGATLGRGLRHGLPGGDTLLNRLLPAGVTNLLTDRPQPPT